MRFSECLPHKVMGLRALSFRLITREKLNKDGCPWASGADLYND